MATFTKSTQEIWSSETFTAGSTHADSATKTITGYVGATVSGKITNGATGPTVALTLQIWTSPNNTDWYKFGGVLSGTTTNSDVVSWGAIPIPDGVQYLKIAPATTNTGQNVTVDADISGVTAIA